MYNALFTWSTLMLLSKRGLNHILVFLKRMLYDNGYKIFFLSGVSQRDYTQYYDHISKQKEEICRCIQDFFKKHIQYKFLDEDCEYFY